MREPEGAFVHATCLVDCHNILGEGCVWDPRDQSLYWTDIEGKRLWRRSMDGAVEHWNLPERVGFVLPRQEPGFVIGFAGSVALAAQDFSTFKTLAVIEADLPQTRVNDAAIDPFGGVVFGTFDERDRKPVASLYRMAADGNLSVLLKGGITISNGIAFSPDGALMYFADTPVGLIRRFSIGADFGTFEEIEPLAGPDIAPGQPDGAIVDSEGFYWSARVWGSCVARISPEGRLAERVELPTRGPTCVALGGADMSQLYITTLRTRHTEPELASAPQAGGLFTAHVAVAGRTALATKL